MLDHLVQDARRLERPVHDVGRQERAGQDVRGLSGTRRP
jgi:hypothetical protein